MHKVSLCKYTLACAHFSLTSLFSRLGCDLLSALVRKQARGQAWSKQKEQKQKKQRRREIKELKRKRKNDLDAADLEELADDTRLLKKLKKGKVSRKPRIFV